jgi:hypothetical protein
MDLCIASWCCDLFFLFFAQLVLLSHSNPCGPWARARAKFVQWAPTHHSGSLANLQPTCRHCDSSMLPVQLIWRCDCRYTHNSSPNCSNVDVSHGQEQPPGCCSRFQLGAAHLGWGFGEPTAYFYVLQSRKCVLNQIED